MANEKISAMPAADALDGSELIAGVQDGANVKITSQAIANLGGDRHAVIEISQEQATALYSFPIENVIPTPGAGKIIYIRSVVGQRSAATAGFMLEETNPVLFCYDNAPFADVFGGDFRLFSRNPDFCLSMNASLAGLEGPSPENQSINIMQNVDGGVWGAITGSSLVDGGVGYVNGDTGYIGDPNLDPQIDSENAMYTVTNAVAGVVQPGGYTISDPGTSYTTMTNKPTYAGGDQPGVGTGLVLDITVDTPQTGHAKIDVYYDIIDAIT